MSNESFDFFFPLFPSLDMYMKSILCLKNKMHILWMFQILAWNYINAFRDVFIRVTKKIM